MNSNKAKTKDFRTYSHMNFFSYFGIGNPFAKFVKQFSSHHVVLEVHFVNLQLFIALMFSSLFYLNHVLPNHRVSRNDFQ